MKEKVKIDRKLKAKACILCQDMYFVKTCMSSRMKKNE